MYFIRSQNVTFVLWIYDNNAWYLTETHHEKKNSSREKHRIATTRLRYLTELQNTQILIKNWKKYNMHIESRNSQESLVCVWIFNQTEPLSFNFWGCPTLHRLSFCRIENWSRLFSSTLLVSISPPLFPLLYTFSNFFRINQCDYVMKITFVFFLLL